MNERRTWPARIALALGLAGLVAACQPEGGARTDSTGASVNRGQLTRAANETATLEGTIDYRQRMTLPKDATVLVKLVDLSHGSSADAVISAHSFPARGQVPIHFELPYDPTLVSLQHVYGVEARILVDGALWFISDQPVAVLTRGAPDNAQVLLQIASQSG